MLTSLFLLGNVYIDDRSDQRIRKVTVSTGIITTVAGSGARDFSGDGGPATSAAMNDPDGFALDSSGILYYLINFTNFRLLPCLLTN